MRREDVEAPVVHVAEELRRAGFDRLSGGRLHRDAPRLAGPGADLVPERRELQLQLRSSHGTKTAAVWLIHW